jgi:hypothetical protein
MVRHIRDCDSNLNVERVSRRQLEHRKRVTLKERKTKSGEGRKGSHKRDGPNGHVLSRLYIMPCRPLYRLNRDFLDLRCKESGTNLSAFSLGVNWSGKLSLFLKRGTLAKPKRVNRPAVGVYPTVATEFQELQLLGLLLIHEHLPLKINWKVKSKYGQQGKEHSAD